MNKKYELLEREKNGLCRIKALKSFGNVKVGDIGGYIEKEENLSQFENSWVYGNAKVRGNARVFGNAKIHGNAEVFENANVYGNAKVRGNAEVYGNAWVCGNAEVYGDARVFGNARVYGNAWVCGNAEVYGDARVFGNARVCGNARVYEGACIEGGEIIGIVNDEYDSIFFIQTKTRLITIYTKNGELYCNIGCQSRMTYDMLERRIEEDGGINPHRQEYLELMKVFKHLIK